MSIAESPVEHENSTTSVQQGGEGGVREHEDSRTSVQQMGRWGMKTARHQYSRWGGGA